MSQRDDAAALQKIIDDVATRSYRIREWWNLELHLRRVETGFRLFNTTLQGVSTGPEFAAQSGVLEVHWVDLRDIDLPEVSSFAQNLEHIDQPVIPGTANYPNPRAGIEALVGAGDGIQHALAGGALDDLKNQSRKFQTALAGQLANRRTMMQHEVEQLCELAYRLRTQLSG